ncbi:MAG: transcriptional regulator GutM [Treponema sp.]|nr:transcriptional regulator GutM [Treponema sp.]
MLTNFKSAGSILNRRAYLKNGRREVCIGSREQLFFVIFILLALQMLFGYVQVRRYQRAVKKHLGRGILGIGQRRGRLKPGELLILVYDRKQDRVVTVQSMSGYTVFARFVELSQYTGLCLDEIRKRGIERDAVEMRSYRKRHPYNPAVLSKKKGALIQAVEAIDLRLRREAEEEEDNFVAGTSAT